MMTPSSFSKQTMLVLFFITFEFLPNLENFTFFITKYKQSESDLIDKYWNQKSPNDRKRQDKKILCLNLYYYNKVEI